MHWVLDIDMVCLSKSRAYNYRDGPLNINVTEILKEYS